jgi:hypothetical protein
MFALRIRMEDPSCRRPNLLAAAIDILRWVDGQPSQFGRDLADFEADHERRAKLDRLTRKVVVQ